MDNDDVLKEFKEAGAILHGHFILSSGLHSDTYLQCAVALMDPIRSQRLCYALAEKIYNQLGKNFADIIVSPAMGGVIVGYEMGRQLEMPSVFCERVDGTFEFRRGFSVENGARVLMIEDVVTTGKSSKEAVECVEKSGGKVVAESCLINRSGSANPLGDKIPLISLAELSVKTYHDVEVPEFLKKIPAVKPGSRWIK